MSYAQQNYLETQVLSASPVELVVQLYEIALDSIDTARRAILAGDIRARGAAISRASEAILELARSIDRSRGDGIGPSLLEIYDFCLRHLNRAHLCGSDRTLAELVPVLRTLRDAWSEIARNSGPSPEDLGGREPVECTF